MSSSDNALSVTNASLTYPSARFPSVRNATFTLASSKILSVVGRSGSGKSSLLRAICGLERPQEGSITLGKTLLSGPAHFVRPDRRPLGFVSQSGDLFPHLTVERNITYGLRRWRRSEKKARCRELLQAVGLDGMEKRYPHQLSGGEAQRIALVRALAPRPSLLLMDEPFSGLDTMLRETMRRVTSDLLRREKTTAIFVTHHPDDALAAGDNVAVMHGGRIVQFAPPREIWENPASTEVASLFSGINDLSLLKGEIAIPEWVRTDQLALGPVSPDSLVNGVISAIEYLGPFQQIFVKPDDHSAEIKVRISPEQFVKIGTKVGVRRT